MFGGVAGELRVRRSTERITVRKYHTLAAYTTAIVSGSIVNIVWLIKIADHAAIIANPIQTDICGLAISAALFGFIIGTTMTDRWYDPIKRIPAMAAGFFIVACVYAFVGLRIEDYRGDQAGMVVIAIPMFVICAVPILSAFAFIGRIFRTRKEASN